MVTRGIIDEISQLTSCQSEHFTKACVLLLYKRKDGILIRIDSNPSWWFSHTAKSTLIRSLSRAFTLFDYVKCDNINIVELAVSYSYLTFSPKMTTSHLPTEISNICNSIVMIKTRYSPYKYTLIAAKDRS